MDVAEDFLSYVMSKDGQAFIEKNGYIRVNETEEGYISKDLSGTLTISGSSSVYPVMEVLVENYSSLNPGVKVTLQQSDSTTQHCQERHAQDERKDKPLLRSPVRERESR